MEVSKYAAAKQLVSEIVFSWWVHYFLRKLNQIIAAVNSCIKKFTYKYAIEVKTTAKEVYAHDKNNGNYYWRKSIIKEMKNFSITFDILEEL